MVSSTGTVAFILVLVILVLTVVLSICLIRLSRRRHKEKTELCQIHPKHPLVETSRSIDPIKSMLAPRVIWMIWVGPAPRPLWLTLCYQTFLGRSGLEVRLVTDESLSRYVTEPLHPSFQYLTPTHQSDYLRCYLLHFHGGGYFDMDSICLRSLVHLWDESDQCTTCWGIGHAPVSWERITGIAAFGPFRPRTPLTEAWYQALWQKMDEQNITEASGDTFAWHDILLHVYGAVAERYRVHLRTSLLVERPGSESSEECTGMGRCFIPKRTTEVLVLNNTGWGWEISALSQELLFERSIGLLLRDALCPIPPRRILILVKAHDVLQRSDHGVVDQFAGSYRCIHEQLSRFADQIDFRLVMADTQCSSPWRDEPDAHSLVVRTEENYWSALLIKLVVALQLPWIDSYDWVLFMNASTFVRVPALVEFCAANEKTEEPTVYGHLWVNGNAAYPFTYPSGLGYLLNRAAFGAVARESVPFVEYTETDGYRCRVPADTFPSTDDIFVGSLSAKGHFQLAQLPVAWPDTWDELLGIDTDTDAVLVRLRDVELGQRLVDGHAHLSAKFETGDS